MTLVFFFSQVVQTKAEKFAWVLAKDLAVNLLRYTLILVFRLFIPRIQVMIVKERAMFLIWGVESQVKGSSLRSFSYLRCSTSYCGEIS